MISSCNLISAFTPSLYSIGIFGPNKLRLYAVPFRVCALRHFDVDSSYFRDASVKLFFVPSISQDFS
jgi:hypothetical protein